MTVYQIIKESGVNKKDKKAVIQVVRKYLQSHHCKGLYKRRRGNSLPCVCFNDTEEQRYCIKIGMAGRCEPAIFLTTNDMEMLFPVGDVELNAMEEMDDYNL